MQVALSTKISAESYVWLESRNKQTNIPKSQIVDAAIQHYKKHLEQIQAATSNPPRTGY